MTARPAPTPPTITPTLANNRPMRDEQLAQGADFTGYQNQLNELLTDPSKIQDTAGYQFQLDQGNQAINRSAAAKGMLGSGNVLAELAKYGQGMGATEYGNQVNRLSGLTQGAQKFGVLNDFWKQPTYASGGGGTNLSWGNPTQYNPWGG